MKRILSLLMATLCVVLCLCGCGKSSKSGDRIMYNCDLSKYVKLGKYKGIKIDTSGEEFKNAFNEVLLADINNHDLKIKKTEGTVKAGDTANIDYVGKKDGVAFEGGTASGYDLEIGSGNFIEGFEDGLIGVEIGSTVDLNLTFPENYNSAELAGQAVVFTVTVNYVSSTDGVTTDMIFDDMGFDSVKAYEEDIKDRACEDCISDKIKTICEVKDYPQDDLDAIYGYRKEYYENYVKQNVGTSLSEYLKSNNLTQESFKDSIITNEVKPFMKTEIVFYAILDKEGLKVTEKDIDAQLDKAVKQYSENGSMVSKEDLIKYNGKYYFECFAVQDKVLSFLRKNAKIS